MSKEYWISDKFTYEFNIIKDLNHISIFKYQIDKVAKIVNHWKECPPCALGFNISEYSGTFEEIFLKLAASHVENHICDGDYDVLDSRSRRKEIYIGC